PDGLLCGVLHSQRIWVDRTHEQGTAEPRLLGERHEDFRLGRLARLLLLDIAGDADDLAREALTQIVDDDLPADWVFAFEILPRHRLIDDRHWAPVRQITIVEFAPGQKGGPQRAEIGRADGAIRHQYVAVGQRIALAVELEVQSAQRRVTHQR